MVAPAINENEILEKLTAIISEVTMMDESEINPSSSLVDELGMESIDFLDVAFKIESAFDIEIPRTNPIQRISDLIGPDRIVQDGNLTEDGVKLLKLIFSSTKESKIRVGMPGEDIPTLINVQTYVNLVKRGLELACWKPTTCHKCEKTDFKKIDKGNIEFPDDIVPIGPVYMCNSCENILLPPSFDEEVCQKLGIELENRGI